jgi:hypothetical protein
MYVCRDKAKELRPETDTLYSYTPEIHNAVHQYEIWLYITELRNTVFKLILKWIVTCSLIYFYISVFICISRSRDSVVGIATGYGRSSSPGRVKNILFPKLSRSALGSTKPPI